VPGWICSGVFHALLLAGLRPVPVDIDASFALSQASAEAAYTSDTSLLVSAPFGGYAPDVAAWLAWAAHRDLPVIADLVQAPDPAVWSSIAAHVPAALTSFRPGKPLGAAGGGLIAGSQQVVEAARTFLNAGCDSGGLKVALGIELPLTAEAAAPALRSVVDTCLPGWAG
jgi:dTDP-4-amino-4,6-dideoxygalactose transaminase